MLPITPKQLIYIRALRRNIGMPETKLAHKDRYWASREIDRLKAEWELMKSTGESQSDRRERLAAAKAEAKAASPQVGVTRCPECNGTARVFAHRNHGDYPTAWCERCKMGWGPADSAKKLSLL